MTSCRRSSEASQGVRRVPGSMNEERPEARPQRPGDIQEPGSGGPAAGLADDLDLREIASRRVQHSARAALDEQHAAVRDLRARTGALLTATSVVVSFLGARALTTSHLRSLAFLGLGVFVLSLVLSLCPSTYEEDQVPGCWRRSVRLDVSPARSSRGCLLSTCSHVRQDLCDQRVPYRGAGTGVYARVRGDSHRGHLVGTTARAIMILMLKKIFRMLVPQRRVCPSPAPT